LKTALDRKNEQLIFSKFNTIAYLLFHQNKIAI